MTSPQVPPNMLRVLLAKPAGRHSPQALHETGGDDLGWKADEEVDVIVLPVQLDKFTAEVLADVGHDLATTVEHRSGERPTPVLGDEHQVDVTVPNCVPALANLAPTICHTHRP